jgi:hypothetical protein
MIHATCHCGGVRLEIATAPGEITECNCSICRRYGVLWAYYDPVDVRVLEAEGTDAYLWDDRAVAFHRCRFCGCVSHWSPTDPSVRRMGVNARLMPADAWTGAKRRHLDGAVTERYLD